MYGLFWFTGPNTVGVGMCIYATVCNLSEFRLSSLDLCQLFFWEKVTHLSLQHIMLCGSPTVAMINIRDYIRVYLWQQLGGFPMRPSTVHLSMQMCHHCFATSTAPPHGLHGGALWPWYSGALQRAALYSLTSAHLSTLWLISLFQLSAAGLHLVWWLFMPCKGDWGETHCRL